jgi:phage repressor protein C with HTH and peptisase S24 domain
LADRGFTKVEGDAVYSFRVDDEGSIKRLKRIPRKGLVVRSENKKYESWTGKIRVDIKVFGRMV